MRNLILNGDCRVILKELESKSVDMIVTSPPYYGLRDYDTQDQIGLEESPRAYISNLLEVFRECRRVLKDNGTLWLNLGDSYWSNKNRNGYDWDKNHGKSKNYMLRPGGDNDLNLKSKDLMGMPWRIAFALQEDGWYLRSDIIWSKSNCMPEPVKDRPTKSHEYVFLLSKSRHYYYDHEAIKEDILTSNPNGSCSNLSLDGITKRNKRSVWHLSTSHQRTSHVATFPDKLIEPCILAGCPPGGIVLDPFMGTGTVAKKAIQLRRDYIGIEVNPDYIKLIEDNISNVQIRLF